MVAGLGLISFITMFCDFIMLNYVSDRKIVSNCSSAGSTGLKGDFQIKQRKFEVLERHKVFNNLMQVS